MIHLNTVQLITNTISLSAGGKNNGLKARMFTILKAQKLA
jgi:hypothetical protein